MSANRITELLSLNDQQSSLMDVDNEFVVQAGAGSGKTRVLVSRYLKIIEQGRAGVDNIAAITFTVNAAGEMKERIRKYIKKYVQKYGDCGTINSDLLRQITDAPISTIHGFAASIIKENPYECGINSNFTILEGLDKKIFTDEAIDEFLAKSYRAKSSLYNLFEYEKYNYSLVKDTLIQVLEIAGRKHLRSENSFNTDKDYDKELKKCYRDMEEVLKYAPHSSSKKRVEEKLQEFHGHISALDNSDNDRDRIALLYNAKEILSGTNSPKGIAHIQASAEHEREFALKCSSLLERIICYHEQEYTNRYIELFLKFRDYYEQKKKSSGCLEYEDLLYNALQLLKNNGQILNHYKAKYTHFLIDEYQDTDSLQDEIINLFSGANKFIVGDPKQSIYGFRGADPKIFQNLTSSTTRSVLSINYRSDHRLVKFFNNLFDRIIKGSYEEMINHSCDEAQKKVKEILCFAEVDGKQRIQLEAESVAVRIKELVKSGYKYKDIAVLLRSKSHIEHFEHTLSQLSIPYYSSEQAGFYRYREIRDIVCFLKCLLNENDKISEASVLRSVFVGASDTDLFNHYVKKKSPEIISKYLEFMSNIREHAMSKNPLEVLMSVVDNTAVWPAVSVLGEGPSKYDSVSRLIEIFSALTQQGKSLSEIIEYLDINYEENTEGLSQLQLDLSDTVKILTVHKAKGLEFAVVIAADINHKKGGGNETVTYSDEYGLIVRQTGIKSAVWKEIENSQKQKDIDEEKRSLYVALTRAREKLIISLCRDKKPSEGTYHDILSRSVDFSRIGEKTRRIEFCGYKIPVRHYDGNLINDMTAESVRTEAVYIDPDIEGFVLSEYATSDKQHSALPDHLSFKLNKIEKGSVMHRFLQVWDFDPASADGISKYVMNESYVTEPKMKNILRELSYNFTNSELYGLIKQADSIKREVAFFIELEGVAERRKIDLLIFNDNNITLVDYKSSFEIKPEYVQQISIYEKALLKKYNCNNIDKYLVHIPSVTMTELN